jgi:hypothetical protein
MAIDDVALPIDPATPNGVNVDVSTTDVIVHVAFVNVVVPMDPETVPVPPLITYWKRSARAAEPTKATDTSATVATIDRRNCERE